ncbi:MAG: hypothetical protein K6G81_10095 [Lachnospiraceae bacterium]|nr:hypothetical protein [Lachnospiraceae bacterium]
MIDAIGLSQQLKPVDLEFEQKKGIASDDKSSGTTASARKSLARSAFPMRFSAQPAGGF